MLEDLSASIETETPSCLVPHRRPSSRGPYSRVSHLRDVVQCARQSSEVGSPKASQSSGSPKARSPKESPKTSSQGMECQRPRSSGTASPCDSIEDVPNEENVQEVQVCPVDAATSSKAPVQAQYPAKGYPKRSSTQRVRIPSRLIINVEARTADVNVDVELTEGEFEGPGALPVLLTEGQTLALTFRGLGPISGTLNIGDAEPIPFGVQCGSAKQVNDVSNFVNEENRQKCTVTHCGDLKAQNSLNVSGEGIVVEASMSDGPRADLSVVVRAPKKKEFRRVQQHRALVSAMENQKYSTLLAQITKARMRKVEASIIDAASRLLKSIKPGDSTFLNHAQLKKQMKWRKVSDDLPGDLTEPCSANPNCPCNAGQAENGEICTVIDGEVAKALEGVNPVDGPADKVLFQALVRAALVAPEGCVWKSGGKFLLTNEERNQSANAIVHLLERNGEDTFAARGIRALVDYTEKTYNWKVTAVQLNFHPNEKTWHKQHRDIYGAGQKAGINCTCTFMKCQGTVCYSLGSSRHVMTETIADGRSKYEACGDDCIGCKQYRVMSSGSAMFFNHKWNNNHTHGVPQLEDACGPRISVALLCA